MDGFWIFLGLVWLGTMIDRGLVAIANAIRARSL